MEKESDKIKKKLLRLVGIGYLLLGIVIILGSFEGITGFVIADGLSGGAGWFFGLVFLGIGIGLLMNREAEGGLVKKIKEKKSSVLSQGLYLTSEEVQKLLKGDIVTKYRSFGEEGNEGEVEEFYSIRGGRFGVGIINIFSKGSGVSYMRELVERSQKTAEKLGYKTIDIYGIAPVDKMKNFLQLLGFEEMPEGSVPVEGYEREALWKKTVSVSEPISRNVRKNIRKREYAQ